MLHETIEAYLETADEKQLLNIDFDIQQLLKHLNYNEIWKIFIKKAKLVSNNQRCIINLAIRFSPYSDLAISNLADHISLDQQQIFEQCYELHKKSKSCALRALRALTDSSESKIQVTLSLFPLTFSDLKPLQLYIQTASTFIFSDFSQFFWVVLNAQIQSFSTSFQSLDRQFLQEIFSAIKYFNLQEQFAQLLARNLIDTTSMEAISQTPNLRNFDVFAVENPIKILQVHSNPLPTVNDLMLSNDIQGAVNLFQNIPFNAKTAISDSLKRVSPQTIMEEISLFSAAQNIDCQKFVQQLNNAQIIENNVVIHLFDEGYRSCQLEEVSISFQKSERFQFDLVRSFCNVEINGVHIKVQGILMVVLERIIKEELLDNEYQVDLSCLEEYGLIEKLDGKWVITEDVDILQVYENDSIEVNSTNVQIQYTNQVCSEILKASVCKVIKLRKQTLQELQQQFGTNIKMMLNELAENDIITINENGLWCFD
ncbi:hypothetical protein SS50377_27593 [Spironucleus salmonicida]|uniref:Uncharacterized protein n=1 Tax=Spironucleus salmonicida TaxID=348837 RepID=V6LPV5_9EUKA|nr:hypothetical protein SS50377_27593 [Spironucleus salmonicida]|eukprot:EST46630.1 Hypothetical protein SS50377_13433 [Spironucleus salmonicida]